MSTHNTVWRTRLVALLTSVAAALTVPLHAQEANIQEVVVTGSRIAAPNLTSTSPVQVVTSKEIQQAGHTDAVEILNQLPQVLQNSATDFSNTSNSLSTPGGLTTVNLRGIGPQRTLVLVDGRRLGTADANTANPNPSANLDQIPVSLIERVDVVTGGASAVYGSDAIAGVVNFIMKKNFEGMQIDAQYGVFQRGNDNDFMQGLADARGMAINDSGVTDGDTLSFSLTAGANIADGNGNVTGYLMYRTADPITGADIDFAGCQLVLNSDGTPRCGGSANSNRFTTSGTQYAVVGDQFVPWGLAVDSTPPPEFNSNAYVNMYRDNERYMGGFMAHVTMSDSFEPYAEFGFMNDRTRVEIGPSGLFENSNPYNASGLYSVNCSNPLLSAQQRSILCTPEQVAADLADPGSTSVDVNIGRRNIEGGPRVAEFEHDNYRAVVGMRGDLSDAWRYDAYGQYYYTSLYNSNTAYLNLANVTNALQATGTADNPVCISGAAGCVPFNIFRDAAVTDEQLTYLYTDGTAYGTVTQKIAHADVTGDLSEYGIKLPTADTGIGINVGVEYRSEDLSFKPDAAELSGNLSGFAGASVAIDDGYDVMEAFTEIRVPLVQGKTGIYDLVVDAGYRYSDYSTAGTTDTYKFELQYAPIQDLRFRGSLQHAIRAPNIIELFNPQSYGQQSFLGVDPCAPLNGAPATRSLADCMNTGVTAAQYGDGGATNTIPQCVSNQCGQVIGGNPDLLPEEADTYSIGVTFSPAGMGFIASIDYYNIELTDAIDAIPGPFLFEQCLNSGDPRYCSQIVRTPLGALTGASVATGGYILQTSVNVAEANLEGIDVQLSYSLPLGENAGALSFALNGATVLSADNTPLPGSGSSYDCAGLFGTTCETITPKWRHNLRISWQSPWDVDVSLNWRFIDGTSLDSNDPDPDLNAGDFDEFNSHMPSVSYFDLSALWSFGTGTTLRTGINNIFDKDPPLISTNVSGTGGPNAYPTYDILGRQAFIGITQSF